MSSNEGIKARRKAFQKAAERFDIGVVAGRFEEEWSFIWERAVRYANRVHQRQLAEIRQHLEEAKERATEVQGDVTAMSVQIGHLKQDKQALERKLRDVEGARRTQAETVSSLLTRNSEYQQELQKLKSGWAESVTRTHSKAMDELEAANAEQARTIQEKVADNNDLRDQVASLMANQVGDEEELAILQGQVKQLTDKRDQMLKYLAEEKTLTSDLKRMNEALDNSNIQLRQQLEETKKHTTSATWKVFEENERLVADLRRLTGTLADEEEINSQLKDKVEGLTTEVNVLRDRLAEATYPMPAFPMCDASNGIHKCQNKRLSIHGRAHPQRHLCHCGHNWA